ncbi:MAG: phosphoribosylanthranilate isomerase [Anaerovibrio sp.]|uniref:phosphoribosylanthranilate isomerase n=1 Tax=Anaerovibrio sp. TaxID=1872532 RepID=UPI0025F764E4|nr:phosphoribosylanthranilate isomerase [Anaerovibrio sp.]MCR5176332.1 phosphoribosylanthranilate isomerase [Anaerovibrio sp.]
MVNIKICGIKDIDSARAAGNADYIGFIMNKQYRRYCPPETVRSICDAIKGPQKVGVFVNQDLAEVNELAEYCGLDFVQLHGSEQVEYAEQIDLPVIKAFRYGDDFSVSKAEAYPAEIVLIDSYSKNTAGGSGISFAWQEAAGEICSLKKPYMIAGGVSADNVGEAIKLFHPYGIDASGSMEINGNKSKELIRKFLEAAGRKGREV